MRLYVDVDDKELLDNIFNCAYDSAYGGSWYWTKKVTIQHPTVKDEDMTYYKSGRYRTEWMTDTLIKGGHILIDVNEGDETVGYITKDSMIKAIQMFIDTYKKVNISDMDLDIEDSDWIIQQAAFSEVVYG